MITLWFAILLLGTPQTAQPEGDLNPERKAIEDPTYVRQAGRWVRAAVSPRPEVARAARRDLEALPLGAVPALETHLHDPSARIVVVEAIESICARALSTMSRVGDEAVSDEERERIDAEFDRAGPAASSALARAILYGRGALREAGLRTWSRLRVPPADEDGWARLGRTVPLSVPMLRALEEEEDPPGRAAAVLREAAEAEIARLGSEDFREREEAAEVIVRIGEAAEGALREAAAAGDAHLSHTVGRLLQQVRWRISTSLVRKIGHRMEGYEEQDWRDRRATVSRLERLGGSDAVPTLRKIIAVEESPAVRIFAAESLARMGDPLGISLLEMEGLAERYLTPRVTVEIYMDQGLRYLREEEYEKAEAEFQKILEVDPENHLAYYNLACAYSLGGKTDKAIESLESAIRNGFDEFDHMEKDEDLDPIRNDPRYRALLERYAPGGSRGEDETGSE